MNIAKKPSNDRNELERKSQPRVTVNEVYSRIKEMAVLYDILPGERINEVDFAKKFGISRSPLREALNRLVAEGLVDFVPNRGFFVRKLQKKDVYNLYQVREIVEVGGIKISINKAEDKEIDEIESFWNSVVDKSEDLTAKELLNYDEQFHIMLITLSRNEELIRALKSINERIRFVRWVDLQGDRAEKSYREHKDIIFQLKNRNEEKAVNLLSLHISRRMEEITAMLNASIIQLYSN